jgi:hypothetical protein
MQSVLRFNGGLFDQATALPLTDEQIGLLIGLRQWDIVICPHKVGGIGRHRQTAHLARNPFTIHNVPIGPLKNT